MDKLLDKEIHQLYKATSATNYLSNLAPAGSSTARQQSSSHSLRTMGEVISVRVL